jgi:hypothetical protein
VTYLDWAVALGAFIIAGISFTAGGFYEYCRNIRLQEKDANATRNANRTVPLR